LAKRRYKKRRAATRTVTRYVKPKGGFAGIPKGITDGLIAGFGGQIVQRWIGEWGHPAATLVTGLWQNNTTLKTEGSRELGALLATKIPFIGGGTSPYAGRNY